MRPAAVLASPALAAIGLPSIVITANEPRDFFDGVEGGAASGA